MGQRLEKDKAVMVFQDPLTEDVPEGMAYLVKALSRKPDHPGLEHWEVEFWHTGQYANRFILGEEPLTKL